MSITDVKPTKNILYVENDPNNQTLIRLFLRNEPYEIITADCPKSAQKALLSQNFDIIIVDLNLKTDGDGAGLIHTIREMPEYKTTPIFVFSGYDITHISKYQVDGLIQRFFLKPTSKSMLIDAIREFDDTAKNQK